MNMSSQQNRNQEIEARLSALENKVWQVEAYLSAQAEADEEDVDEI